MTTHTENDSNSTYCEQCGCRITQGMCSHGTRAQPLPAFRVTRSTGGSYVTSMATGTSLETARAYFMGNVFTDESPAGVETKWTATAVESV